MSDKYTTDGLIGCLEVYRTFQRDMFTKEEIDAIIARLRAGDALCQEARELAWIATIYPHIDLSKISKAIADYEEAT